MNQALKVTLWILAVFIVIVLLLLILYLVGSHILTTKAAEIARTKCEEYVKQICDDSNPKNKPPSINGSSAPIMGGKFASDGQLPHMVYLRSKLSNGSQYSCSGSIISEYFILTAAHCIHGTDKNDISVYLGAANHSHVAIPFKVDEIKGHPAFDFDDLSTSPNDVAVLKLNRKIEFDWKTRPICLNYDFESISTENLTVSGWGRNEYGFQNQVLQVVETYVDGAMKEKCKAGFGEENMKVMYCAGHPTERKGPCPGDSGGCLQIPLKNGCPNTYEQVGITQSIIGECSTNTTETQLALYVKVELLLVWIVSNVWPDLL